MKFDKSDLIELENEILRLQAENKQLTAIAERWKAEATRVNLAKANQEARQSQAKENAIALNGSKDGEKMSYEQYMASRFGFKIKL